MQYRQLRDMLNDMTEKELSYEVTALAIDAGEFIPVTALVYADHTDTLDKGHPYFYLD
jgi:hypothetical protein